MLMMPASLDKMKLVAVSYLQVPGESPGFLTRSAMMRELSIFVDESGDRNANSGLIGLIPKHLVPRTGFEPAAFRSGGERSIH